MEVEAKAEKEGTDCSRIPTARFGISFILSPQGKAKRTRRSLVLA